MLEIDYNVLADEIYSEFHHLGYVRDDEFAKEILSIKFDFTGRMLQELHHRPETRTKIVDNRRNPAYIKILDNALIHLAQLTEIIAGLNKAASNGTLSDYLKNELPFAEKIVYFAYKNKDSVHIGRAILNQIPVFQADSRLNRYFERIIDFLITNGDYELIIKLELLTFGYRAYLQSSLSYRLHSALNNQAYLIREIARDQQNNKALELSHYFDLALYVQEFFVSLKGNIPFTLKPLCGLTDKEKTFLIKLINNIAPYLPSSLCSTSATSPIHMTMQESGQCQIEINNQQTEIFDGYYVDLTESVDNHLIGIINEVAYGKAKLKIEDIEDLLVTDLYFKKKIDYPINIAYKAFQFKETISIGELILDLISSQPDETSTYRPSYRSDSDFYSLLHNLIHLKKEKYFAKLISFPYGENHFPKIGSSANIASIKEYAEEKDYQPICRYLTLHQYIVNVCAHKSQKTVSQDAFPFDDLSQEEIDFINICVVKILRHHPELRISDPRIEFRDKLIARPRIVKTLSEVDQSLINAIMAEDETKVDLALQKGANANVAYVRNFSENNRNYHYELLKLITPRLFPDGHYQETVYPLHLASDKANLNIINQLLEYHADPTQRDSHGYSPLRTLTRSKNKEKTPKIISLLANDSRVNPDDADLIKDLIYEKNPQGLLALIENPRVHWFIFNHRSYHYSFSSATLEMLIIMLTSANSNVNYGEYEYSYREHEPGQWAINQLAKTVCTRKTIYYPDIFLFDDSRKDDGITFKKYLKIRFLVLNLFNTDESIIENNLSEEEINEINKEEYRWFIRTIIKHHLVLHEFSGIDLLDIFDSVANTSNNYNALREVEIALFLARLKKTNVISKKNMLRHLTPSEIHSINSELRDQYTSFWLSVIMNTPSQDITKITYIFTNRVCSEIIDYITSEYLETTSDTDDLRISKLRHMQLPDSPYCITGARGFINRFQTLFIDLILIYLSQNSFISSTMPMLERFINDSERKKFYKNIFLFMMAFLIQTKPEETDLEKFIIQCLRTIPISSRESIYMLIKNSNKLSWIQEQLMKDFKNEEVRNVFTSAYYRYEMDSERDMNNDSAMEDNVTTEGKSLFQFS